MDRLSKQGIGTVRVVLAVIAFNVIMLALLEIPLLGYATSPQRTERAVARFNGFLKERGARTALIAAIVIGLLLSYEGSSTGSGEWRLGPEGRQPERREVGHYHADDRQRLGAGARFGGENGGDHDRGEW